MTELSVSFYSVVKLSKKSIIRFHSPRLNCQPLLQSMEFQRGCYRPNRFKRTGQKFKECHKWSSSQLLQVLVLKYMMNNTLIKSKSVLEAQKILNTFYTINIFRPNIKNKSLRCFPRFFYILCSTLGILNLSLKLL